MHKSNFTTRLKNFVFSCAVLLTLNSQVAHAQTISTVDLRSSANGYSAVIADATRINRDFENRVPNTKLSYPSTSTGNRTLIGYFKANSAADRVAVFSDDGCSISIEEVNPADYKPVGPLIRYLSNAGVQQALPDLAQSLHQIAFVPATGKTYKFTINYTNLIYTGDAAGSGDLDGANVYLYTDSSPAPTPTPTPTRSPILLWSDQVTTTSARLQWTRCPDADFQSYSLFSSKEPLSADNLAKATRLLSGETRKDATEFKDSSLVANTHFYYVLRVRYTDNSTQDTSCDFITPAAEEARLTFVAPIVACAGHVAGSVVHEINVQGKAVVGADNHVAPNVTFSLSFDNNVGKPKEARFVMSSGSTRTEVPTVTLTSDSEGKVAFTVISSDVITNRVVVKATTQNESHETHDAGSVSCDFRAAEASWEFGKVNGSRPEDIVWNDPNALLSEPGNLIAVRAKVQFIQADGTKALVDSHDLHLTFGDLIINPDMAALNVPVVPRTTATLYFSDVNGKPLKSDGTAETKDPAPGAAWPDFITAHTGGNGYTLPLYMRAGPLIHRCAAFKLRLIEQTQKK